MQSQINALARDVALIKRYLGLDEITDEDYVTMYGRDEDERPSIEFLPEDERHEQVDQQRVQEIMSSVDALEAHMREHTGNQDQSNQ